MSQLYNRIKALCDQKNVTIARMCKEANIPNSVIYELKSGKREGISTKTALKIADYFEVSLSYLFPSVNVDTGAVSDAVLGAMEAKNNPPIMDGKTYELAELLNGLSDENLDRALDYVRYLISTQNQ